MALSYPAFYSIMFTKPTHDSTSELLHSLLPVALQEVSRCNPFPFNPDGSAGSESLIPIIPFDPSPYGHGSAASESLYSLLPFQSR